MGWVWGLSLVLVVVVEVAAAMKCRCVLGFFLSFCLWRWPSETECVRVREIIKNGGGNETGLEVKERRTAQRVLRKH